MTRKLSDSERQADREARAKAEEDYVKKILAQAPPLTADVKERLRLIFAGGNPPPKKRVVDTAQAAQMLKCGVRQVARMRNQGRLKATRVGSRWFYDHDHVVWLRESLERAARNPQALHDATLNELLDMLIQDRLQKEWNPR